MEHLANFAQMVGPAFDSMLNFEQKKQNLKRKLEELKSRETDIKIELKHQDSASSGKKQRNEVENWLRNVERVKDEVLSMEKEVGFSRLGAWLGSRIDRMTEEVVGLIDKGRFEGGLVLDAREVRRYLLTTNMVGRAFQRNMDEILAWLGNGEILRIGVYGMGGLGKTTLMTHVYNRVLKNPNTFGDVYWVTVPQNFNIHRLQSRIAKTIGFDISDEDDEKKRAAELSEAINRLCKCIIILDDLWNHFSEEQVGLPVEIGGCKLILTSRSLDVCQQMDCKVQIKVETLSKEESCSLFMEKLGCEMPLPPEINEIAKSIASECDGLPLGIITMARSMRGVDDVCEWRNALKELTESKTGKDNMEDEVFQVLQFSYDRLNDRKLQLCFLYCALFPEGYEVKRGDLIEYLIDEGVIEGTDSRRAQFDKGNAMLNKLVNVCLLEGSENAYGEKCVKMHDLIRDMALHILNSVSHVAMVGARKQLKEIPYDEKCWTEDLLMVSLVDNDIKEIPSLFSPRCSNLSTLLLYGNRHLVRIADSFFQNLHGLKVLDLSYTNIEELPDTAASLENLTALVLKWCCMLKYVPSLAKLRALRKLDLMCTGLERVPEGMELLSKLTYLNLIGTKIKHLPCGIFPRLSHLQYLGIPCRSKTSKLMIREVRRLQKLEALICWFQDIGDYNDWSYCIDTRMLSKYYFLVASTWEPYVDDMNFDLVHRDVKYDGITSNELRLPKGTQRLAIYGGCIDDRQGLCLRDGNELKSLTIEQCEMIECLFYLFSCPYIFQSLETLDLFALKNLTVLFSEEIITAPYQTTIPSGAFCNLKIFEMFGCDAMKKLFHPALMRNLQNLEVLRVSNCSELEEITTAEEGQEDGGSSSSNQPGSTRTEFSLPKLRVLQLVYLPKLKRICGGKIICNALQKIQILCCKELTNIPLPLPVLSLQRIQVYPEDWWDLVKWDHSTDKSVLHPLCVVDEHA